MKTYKVTCPSHLSPRSSNAMAKDLWKGVPDRLPPNFSNIWSSHYKFLDWSLLLSLVNSVGVLAPMLLASQSLHWLSLYEGLKESQICSLYSILILLQSNLAGSNESSSGVCLWGNFQIQDSFPFACWFIIVLYQVIEALQRHFSVISQSCLNYRSFLVWSSTFKEQIIREIAADYK